MTKRMLTCLLAFLLVIVGAPAVAGAYPPGGTTVATNATAYKPGSPVVITAAGFTACAGQTVTFTITSPSGSTIVVTATANAQGVATVTITAPDTLGTYTVVASSPGCEDARTTFLVRLLPAAGSETAPWLVSAAVAVGAGLLFVVVARRRRQLAH